MCEGSGGAQVSLRKESARGTGGDDDEDGDDKQETAMTATTNTIRETTEQEGGGVRWYLLSTGTLFISIYVLL